ncbi:MAG TPA: BatA and WFA domain-containing protein [Vicinamibacterales bacterium]|nr:BatA and WFA domain-containing protein [Vicinamibacterales bacterium]
MSFLYPLFLAGAAAAVLPIVLHLLRRDAAPTVPFTAVRLLRKSPVERVHKRRLRDLLLLIARVTALLLLAAAFARPYVQGAAPSPLTVVAIDRSFSMGGDDRFARAANAARAAIDRASSGDRVAVVAFDDRAQTVAEPGGKGDARAALQGLTAGSGATRYEPLFEKVRELAGGAAGHLVIVSDLQQGGWAASASAALPDGWDLRIEDLGDLPANASVTGITVERDRVMVALGNAGAAPRSGRVRIEHDGREVGMAPYTVPARETVRLPIAWRAPSAGALRATIDDEGGLSADDSRYVVLGVETRLRVLVVITGGAGGGRSGLYLARALETSGGGADAVDVTVAPAARVSAMTAAELAGYPVIALLSTRGLERRAREAIGAQLQRGTGLFVAASPDIEASVLSSIASWTPALAADERAAAPATLAATDPRHPIFRPFGALAANLGQVRFDRMWRVAADGWQVVARFSNGTPALLERSLGQGRVVLFASDVDRRWNDFPLHPSFVPFALETVRYAAGDRRRPHDYTVGNAPAEAGGGPGVFRMADDTLAAVNVDLRESDPARMTPETFERNVQRSPASGRAGEVQAVQTEARQSYWQYGLLVMIAALVAESFVGRS